jgi:hypothetical protein
MKVALRELSSTRFSRVAEPDQLACNLATEANVSIHRLQALPPEYKRIFKWMAIAYKPKREPALKSSGLIGARSTKTCDFRIVMRG